MTSQNDINWNAKYEQLKEYIASHGHLPDKHRVESRNLLSWAKYQRRKIKDGKLSAEKQALFLDLMATRSNEHTGGRRRRVEPIIQHLPRREGAADAR